MRHETKPFQRNKSNMCNEIMLLDCIIWKDKLTTLAQNFVLSISLRDAHLLTICRAKLEGTLWWFSACMLVMACVVVTVCAGATSTLQKLEVLSVHVHIKSVHRIKMISVDSRYSKRKLIDIYVAFLVRSLTSFIVIFWHHPWFIFTEIYLL